MTNTIYDLRVAELHCRELQAQAEHERLVHQAIAANLATHPRSFMARALNILRKRNPDTPPSDPRHN
jgi:hypothetical protein